MKIEVGFIVVDIAVWIIAVSLSVFYVWYRRKLDIYLSEVKQQSISYTFGVILKKLLNDQSFLDAVRQKTGLQDPIQFYTNMKEGRVVDAILEDRNKVWIWMLFLSCILIIFLSILLFSPSFFSSLSPYLPYIVYSLFVVSVLLSTMVIVGEIRQIVHLRTIFEDLKRSGGPKKYFGKKYIQPLSSVMWTIIYNVPPIIKIKDRISNVWDKNSWILLKLLLIYISSSL